MTWTIPNILTVFRLAAAPAVALVFVFFARPLADWLAFALFIGASVTDYVDGWLARKLNQQSRFGAMLDPIADKAMVIIALAVVLALSAMDPWIILPASVIFLREVFVSGLREFLGADAGRLAVTKLAKWKTTAQMVAIAVLLVSYGFSDLHNWMAIAETSASYQTLMEQRGGFWWIAMIGSFGLGLGMILLWIAGVLTAITGWDYLRKAMPYLAEAGEEKH
ncbi:MAG: CDP-diacylglycerol--glycerol-3-phosphate 3-phosphatidyltransferase [Mangrovicoccus sp.]